MDNQALKKELSELLSHIAGFEVEPDERLVEFIDEKVKQAKIEELSEYWWSDNDGDLTYVEGRIAELKGEV